MKILKIVFLLLTVLSYSCKDKPKSSGAVSSDQILNAIKTETVNYSFNGKNYKSFAAFNPTLNKVQPVILVFPEWWGLTDYAKDRAKQLAELGYFALAVDFYGEGKTVDNPTDAEKLSMPFYSSAANSKAVFDAAVTQLQKYPNADQKNIAIIGYCFGGAQALNIARQESSLKGVVSFHGNLMTGVKPNNNNKVKLLVCNGAADSFVPAKEIEAFKKQMDSAKINYKFINYPNSLHAFTNPAATEMGKKFNLAIAYNKAADEKSWSYMKVFLADVFK